jgi:hypothetical protein
MFGWSPGSSYLKAWRGNRKQAMMARRDRMLGAVAAVVPRYHASPRMPVSLGPERCRSPPPRSPWEKALDEAREQAREKAREQAREKVRAGPT